MKLRGTVLAGVTAATLMVSGAVLAAVINELPQDAVPIEEPTAALNRQTPPQAPPIESAAEAEPASAPSPFSASSSGSAFHLILGYNSIKKGIALRHTKIRLCQVSFDQ